ncbi:DUF3560 domain-containing protein [Gordonia sp. SID5947]|uniref:DUF3560 domain-containing protein n=1 Tax=Gordonia sp. SID5947 TaxID=2690315 RepID=UPI0013701C7E|nr:DUF3560 domain-containing protein [Gordonia sp. SID5947]MYR08970.1 DUF3560 domain-containing protein [Gordonia sp. SID5947]
MATITITHTPTDGTLVDGTSRGDGTNTILKSVGFRWFRTLGMWGVPNSRDHQPNRYKIEQARRALADAGHDVTVELDTSFRDTATVEADKAARQQDRADALDAKADRHRRRADDAWDADRRATAALPPGGEPIKIGHHNERRHRRAIDNAHAKLGQAIAAENQATDTARRADIAADAGARRHNPRTVANRIDTLEADQRRDERARDGHTRTLYTTSSGQKVCDETPPATGSYREQLDARIAQRADQIAHWKQVRADQIASGEAGNYSPATIAKGDQVRSRFDDWCTVLRVNKKSVSVETPAPFGGRMIRGTLPYQSITGHRPTTTHLDETG